VISSINTPIHPTLDGWLRASQDVETRLREQSHCAQSTQSAAIQWLNTKHAAMRGTAQCLPPTPSLHEWQFHAWAALTPGSPRYQPKVTNNTYRIYIILQSNTTLIL